MTTHKLTLYLDKGAIGALDLHRLKENFTIFYSEATLLDLLNDQSDIRQTELQALNDVGALYLYRDGDLANSKVADALLLMEEIGALELDIMVDLYRFFNGGGNDDLFAVFERQLSILLRQVEGIGDMDPRLHATITSHQDFKPLRDSTSEAWRREQQRSTKLWSQDKGATLRTVFDKNPDLARGLREYFPENAPNFTQVQMAAMLLGILHLGQDRGISSPADAKSHAAARRGYIDCLHIAFGLHCDVFLTTDKATRRRFQVLNEYWGLEKKCALVARAS